MVRPGAIQRPDTPGSPIEPITALIHDFQQAPFECFHENELHAKFYSMCRAAFSKYSTADGQQVAAFRYQYETIWRYRQGDRFAQRHRNTGATATFDFVVLKQDFIHRSPYVTVANKHEQSRAQLRCPPESESVHTSRAVQCAIELKMTNLTDALETTESDVNRLEDRLPASCCKLASERVKQAYIIGLSHDPLPEMARAHAMVANCLQLHQARYLDGNVGVLVATPTQTVLGGDWPEGVEFPNVVVMNGWPVSNDETS